MRIVAPTLTLLAALALTACSNEPVTLAAAGDSCRGAYCDSTTVTPATTTPTYVSIEQQFVDDVMDTPGLTSSVPRSDLISVGLSMCGAIGEPGLTHQTIVDQVGTSKWGPQVVDVVLTAAERHLCPASFYRPSGVAATFAATPTTIPTGPATTLDDGTYEVGVDIEAGKYKSAGGSSCYWARLKEPGGDIIANDLGDGPRTVTVRAGEYFSSQRCGTWTKA